MQDLMNVHNTHSSDGVKFAFAHSLINPKVHNRLHITFVKLRTRVFARSAGTLVQEISID